MTDFDEKSVIDLVEEALAEGQLKPEHTIPLGFGQGELLEKTFSKLEKWFDNADIQVIFDELRTELHAGIDLGTLKDIHTIALNCRRCAKAVAPDPHLPKWNLHDPDVMFVVESPSISGDATKLFVDAMVKAGFSSKRVCLTYVNRCPPLQKLEPGHIRNCLPYLHSEIQLLRPKLIVPLGLLPLASITGAETKLADARGNIMWLGPWAICPTYSPAYVMKAGDVAEKNFRNDIAYAFSFCYGESK